MAKPLTKVFIEFNTTFLDDFTFVLDDATQGQLDGSFGMAGFVFVEVTEYLQAIDLERGKTRILDRFDAGLVNVQFDNSTRVFDPRYQDSPFFGAIIPRLNIRVETNNEVVFTGVILDWNIEYDPSGQSIATAVCSDKFTLLTQTILAEEFNDIQFSGQRINEILSRPEVDWIPEEKDIDTGLTILQEDLIGSNTTALAYFQTIENTEQGALFMAKDGRLTFRQRNTAPLLKASFSDDGSAISYTGIAVVFGSELLFNRIQVTPLGLDTAVVDDVLSQAFYGLSVLAVETLHEYDSDAEELALSLATQFSQPEYRFESIEVDMNFLTTEQQQDLLEIELNDLVTVSFTPSKIPPPIELGAKVIGINHTIDRVQHFMTLNLASLAGSPFVLDSPSLGVLDTDTLAY